MPTARIRNGELTVPLSDDVQEKLGLRDGDELEAHIFNGGLSLTPTSAEARGRAWDNIVSIIDQVRLRSGQQPLTEDEIVEEVKAYRRARRARAAHD